MGICDFLVTSPVITGASFLAGASVGALITFKFSKKKNITAGAGNAVDQSYAQAGGDNVGGNKTTFTN